MSLGSWGRFLVLITGGSIVVTAILIVACFVGPGCWGFNYLRKEEKKKNVKNIEKLQPKVGPKPKKRNHWLNDRDYVIYETSPRNLDSAVITNVNELSNYYTKEKVFNLKCAPLLVAPNLYSTVKTSIPKLEVKLFYCSLGEEGLEGRLTVQIISCSVLPPREYIATLDPFVTLEILNNKWSLQKNERIVHTVQTEVVKNSLNPTFNSTFVFDVKKFEMKNWCLKFTIFDDDRLTKVTPLFERRIQMKDLKDFTKTNQISLNLEMQEVVENVGALFFGINYLPTAQRLNICVVKASKLKFQNSVRSRIEFYPYVRVVMVNNHGKCVKKKKTQFRHKDENPVFDSTLMFDLSISNLEQTVFLVLLCTKTLCQPYDVDDSSLDGGDVEAGLKDSQDRVLGTIVLGRNVRCTRARDHWVSVMQNPRKMISVWHDLR